VLSYVESAHLVGSGMVEVFASFYNKKAFLFAEGVLAHLAKLDSASIIHFWDS
jgi:hypothetical protein